MKFISIFILSVFLLFFAYGCGGFSHSQKGTLLLKAAPWTLIRDFEGLSYSMKESSLICPMRVHGSVEKIADPGQYLEKDAIAVQIRSERLEADLRKQQRNLSTALRKLENEKRKIEKEKLELNLAALEKEYSVKIKEKEIWYASGEKDQKVLENIELQITLLSEKLKFLRQKLDSYEILASSQSISVDELESLRKELKVTDLKRSQEQLEQELKIRGVEERELKKLRLEHEQLMQEWEKSLKDKEDKKQSFALREEKQQLVVEKRKKDLEKSEALLAQTLLKAPESGYFMQVKHPWKGEYIGEGEEVWRGMEVGKVVDFKQIAVKLRIPEQNIEEIKVGQAMKLSSVLSGKATSGVVDKIESIAQRLDNRNKKSGKFYWAHVTPAKCDIFVPGESVKATVQVTAIDNGVPVPSELVKELKGKKVSLITKDGKELEFSALYQTADYVVLPGEASGKEVNYVQVD
jgi:multidrug resistance efflux pump